MLGAPELLMTVFMVLFPAVGLYLAYWVIRLGVRHGLQDVQDGARGARPPARPGGVTSELSSKADSAGR